MVRPKKPTGTTRALRLEIRLTQDEQVNLFAKAAERGLSVSDYIRLTVLNSKPIAPKATPERAALIRGLMELQHIGNNLNQIARVLNADRLKNPAHFIPSNVLNETAICLKSLSDHLHNILNANY